MRKMIVFVSLLLILSLGQFAFAQNYAAVRLLNLSADAGPLDVFVQGSRIMEGFAFNALEKVNRIYFEAKPTRFEFKLSETGQTIVDVTRNLQSGEFLTLAITGTTPDFTGLFIDDDRSTITDKAKLRLVHADPDIQTNSIELQLNGVAITGSIAYLLDSGYSDEEPGTYNIDVVNLDTGDIIASFNANLAPATNYSVYLVGQGGPLYRLLIDDKEGDYEQ